MTQSIRFTAMALLLNTVAALNDTGNSASMIIEPTTPSAMTTRSIFKRRVSRPVVTGIIVGSTLAAVVLVSVICLGYWLWKGGRCSSTRQQTGLAPDVSTENVLVKQDQTDRPPAYTPSAAHKV